MRSTGRSVLSPHPSFKILPSFVRVDGKLGHFDPSLCSPFMELMFQRLFFRP